MVHRIKHKQPYMVRSLLKDLYIKEGLSESELADIFYTSRSTIHRWLLRHKIPLRDFSKTMIETHWCSQTKERKQKIEAIRQKVRDKFEEMGWIFEE